MSRGVNWDKVRRQNRVSKPLDPRPFIPKVRVKRARVRVCVWGAHRAEWRLHNRQWGCWRADPGLQWMIGLTPIEAGIEAKRRGLDYRWENNWDCF